MSNANDATRGRITVTAGGAGSISLTVTVSGVAYGPFVVPFTVEDDPAPTNQGANGGTDPTLALVPSTAFVQMTSVDASEDILTATIAAGQSLVGTAPLTYDFQPNTNASDSAVLVARWQYRTAGSGGSWLDFVANTSIAGSAAHWFANDFSGSPGSGQFNQTKAGLAAGTYECRLVGALQTYADGSIVISQGAATLSVA